LELERLGVPTALCCTTPFTTLAAMEAQGKGFTHFPLVVLPHPFGTQSDGEIGQIADAVLDRVVALLTGQKLAASVGGGAER
jgi:hypothetical protein